LTSSAPHLLVALSAHGYGHAAQTAAVVNRLRNKIPRLRVTLRTTLARDFLARRFAGEFDLIPESTDIGMHMASAIEVRVQETAHAYRAFHRDWDARVTAEGERLRALKPDLLLANVPYLPLAGAAAAAIPACALCSLNWADIDAPDAPTILAHMLDAYRSAQAFLQPAPHMPMADLDNRRAIGPIATVAERPADLAARLGLPAETRMVHIALGGMELRFPIERWPRVSGVHWVVPASWRVVLPDVTAFESLKLNFPDALAGSAGFVTKPGYGSFAEAGCAGVPVLYLRRRDWPEEPYLVDWLARHTRCGEIARDALECGDVVPALDALWRMPAPPRARPTGVEQAAEHLAAML